MTGTQKKTNTYNIDGFCGHYNTVFEAMMCYYLYCPKQEARPSFTEEENQRSNKKGKLDQIRKDYIQKNGYCVIEM